MSPENERKHGTGPRRRCLAHSSWIVTKKTGVCHFSLPRASGGTKPPPQRPHRTGPPAAHPLPCRMRASRAVVKKPPLFSSNHDAPPLLPGAVLSLILGRHPVSLQGACCPVRPGQDSADSRQTGEANPGKSRHLAATRSHAAGWRPLDSYKTFHFSQGKSSARSSSSAVCIRRKRRWASGCSKGFMAAAGAVAMRGLPPVASSSRASAASPSHRPGRDDPHSRAAGCRASGGQRDGYRR